MSDKIRSDEPSSDASVSASPAADGRVLLTIISLWQPYLALIHERIKTDETRSFRLPARLVGQWVGLHATATFPPMRHISEELNDLCTDIWGCGYHTTRPQGAITCAVRFAAPVRTEDAAPDRDCRIAGDYGPNRWAWPIIDFLPFAKPIPAKGRQGFWKHLAPFAAGQFLTSKSVDGSSPQINQGHSHEG